MRTLTFFLFIFLGCKNASGNSKSILLALGGAVFATASASPSGTNNGEGQNSDLPQSTSGSTSSTNTDSSNQTSNSTTTTGGSTGNGSASDNCITSTNVLYVNGDTGNNSNPGTKDSPLLTIQRATAIATSGQTICIISKSGNASYDESAQVLVLPSGVNLKGGYSSSLTRDLTSNLSKITSNRIGIQINNLNTASEISGIDLMTTPPGDASNSSIGILVLNGTSSLTVKNSKIESASVPSTQSATPGSSYGLVAYQLNQLAILSSRIKAGDGGNGADGANGTNGISGGDGSPGAPGRIDDESQTVLGGNGGTNASFSSLNGFRGGNGDQGNTATVGQAGSGPCGGSAGTNAAPGNPGANATCTGTDGSNGTPGAKTGNSFGTVNVYYFPANGTDGTDGVSDGTPGSGGGGGGGEACTLCIDGTGNGGGGGGAAGSKATKGFKPSGGGASVAVFVSEITNLSFDSSHFQSGKGGNSGKAGKGGDGGAAGQGGAGGTTGLSEIGQGGNGSRGGKGGDGGAASGGGGGPSLAFFYKNVSSFLTFENNQFTTGNGGTGGDSYLADPGNGGHSIGIYKDGGGATAGTLSTFTLGNAGAQGTSTDAGRTASVGTRANTN